MQRKQVLFVQGGGENGYEADKALFLSLKHHLGEGYQVHYPEMQADENAPDFGWIQQIDEAVSGVRQPLILVGHSFGASMILKYLTENPVSQTIAGVFLLATPFWSGSEAWQAGLKLMAGFAGKLPPSLPIFFYHCHDDEEVPFTHFGKYREQIAGARFREPEAGRHQFNKDLALVAGDIKALTA